MDPTGTTIPVIDMKDTCCNLPAWGSLKGLSTCTGGQGCQAAAAFRILSLKHIGYAILRENDIEPVQVGADKRAQQRNSISTACVRCSATNIRTKTPMHTPVVNKPDA